MSQAKDDNLDRRLLDLVEASFDGTIDSAGMEELTRLVESDPQALAVYVQFVNLHSALRQRCQTQAIEAESAGEPLSQDLREELLKDVSTPKWRWTNYLSALAVSVLFGIGLFAYLIIPSSDNELVTSIDISDQPAEEGADMGTVENVAVLTRLVDVVWDEESTPWGPKQSLPRQRIDIESGLIQIEFYCGAAVIIEGPASFELLDPDRGFAHHGKLRAYVPARAQGFVIETNSGDVVDLGTEFGLQVTADGQSELHVLDGEVDFHSSSTEASGPQRIIGGQSIRFDQENLDDVLLNADSDRFVSPAELKARTDQESLASYQNWVDYHVSLREDPALVADYVFDDSHGWGRTLVNAAPSADESSYGAIVGANWQRGRWEYSQALRFRSPSDRVRINLRGEFESLSLASWVHVQKFVDVTNIALLHPEIDHSRTLEQPKQRFIHWTLVRALNGAVPHFAESAGSTREDRNHYGPGKMGVFYKDLGRWIHLAVVYDRDSRLVSHYKNGELIGSSEIESPRKLEIGTGDLCNWPYQDWAAGTQFEYRNLNGMMDEFIVLSRGLSADEVREMYEVGKP